MFFLKEKDVPNGIQLCDEFGLNESTVYQMKINKNSNRYDMYSKAWLFKMLMRYSGNKIERHLPTIQELVHFTYTTRANISLLKKKKSRLYDVYIDAYNLERVFIKCMGALNG